MELTLRKIGGFGRSGGVERSTSARKAFYLGAFLCLLQALDGIFTSMGVSRFGTAIEGNPLIRSLMEEFGCIPTLSLLKFFSVIVIIWLAYFATKLSWVNSAMGAVSCVYVLAAIAPWTYILFIQPYII